MSEVINLVSGGQKENRSPRSEANGEFNLSNLYINGFNFSAEVEIIEG